MLRKLGQNYQIAIPRAFVAALDLHINDYFDIEVRDNKIVIEPQVLVPKTQAYFHTPQWQADETAAAEDIRKGKTTKTRNIKELLHELDK